MAAMAAGVDPDAAPEADPDGDDFTDAAGGEEEVTAAPADAFGGDFVVVGSERVVGMASWSKHLTSSAVQRSRGVWLS